MRLSPDGKIMNTRWDKTARLPAIPTLIEADLWEVKGDVKCFTVYYQCVTRPLCPPVSA